MQKEWKDKLRESLEDYQEEMPAGLWDDILKRMEPAGSSAGRKKASVIWHYVAGAAVAAVLALFLIRGGKDTPETVTVIAPEEQQEILARAVEEGPRAEGPMTEGMAVAEPVGAEMPVPSAKTLPHITSETEKDNCEEPSASPDGTGAASAVPPEEVADVKNVPAEGGETLPWNIPEDEEKSHPVALSVAGVGMAGSENQKNGYGWFSGSDVESQFLNGGSGLGAVEYENANKVVSTSTTFKMPIRVSLNASWRFHPRFRLTSGLTYSLLLSELKSGSEESYHETYNTLHYLGIPLSVDFSIWRNRRWDFYLSLGGMMEKCIAGKTATRYIAAGQQVNYVSGWQVEDPLQWSVKGGAGVQVMLGRIVGLYLEPMATYYFDNGSYIPNVYKERPWNFGLNFGVRFEF